MVKQAEKNRRVVVTGLGVVSSLGIGWEEFWKNLIAGKSGISKITLFDTSEHDRHYGGEVKNFDPSGFINKGRLKHLGRASQMAIVASKLAIKDAGLKLKEVSGARTAVCLGTTMGEIQVVEQILRHAIRNKETDIINFRALAFPASNIPMNIAQELKISGPNLIFSNACAAGNFSVINAYDLIKTQKVDLAISGGVDALSRIAFTGFSRLYSMAPEKCQPFDKNRKGMMLGEGAGILVLESLESAILRKANIYAEILGSGLSCDAHHMTSPSSNGIFKAITKSLKSSRISNDQIDYINAHGTGTHENDKAECSAIRKVFGEKTKNIPVSSIKSMLGHSMGAAAALESIVCCLSICDDILPPTINFEHKDEECDIDCISNVFRKKKTNRVLNNAQAFGGNNACILLGDLNE